MVYLLAPIRDVEVVNNLHEIMNRANITVWCEHCCYHSSRLLLLKHLQQSLKFWKTNVCV